MEPPKAIFAGDRARMLVTGQPERTGGVLNSIDLGDPVVDVLYQIRWGGDTPGGEQADWFSARYVFPVEQK